MKLKNNYIEAIYRLQRRNGAAKTTELARELNVVPGSVTNTIEHLKKHGLVKHEPYRGVKLTAKGEKLALNILREHRLAERLLTDILMKPSDFTFIFSCLFKSLSYLTV